MSKPTDTTRRGLLGRLLGGAGMLSLAGVASAAENKPVAGGEQRGVVYHIDDSDRAIAAIRNIGNHRKADAGITIAVVTLAQGIDFLLEDAKDDRGNHYAALIDGLMFDNVSFHVCRNTLAARKINEDRVHFGVGLVQSGVAEVARLQLQHGYAYIKP